MTKKKSEKPEYETLGIKVNSYNVSVSADINRTIRRPNTCRGDEHIYEYRTHLEIEGVCNHPKERAGELHSIRLYSLHNEDDNGALKLQDCRAKDGEGMPLMRTVQGSKVLVFEVPEYIGTLKKRRGENHWDTHLQMPKQIISNMLSLLSNISPLYFYCNEVIEGKTHHVRQLSLQTNDPSKS